jgi:hypothetical protein
MLAVLALVLLTAGGKNEPYVVGFHTQANPNEPERMIFPSTVEGRNLVFHRLPEISHRNFRAFEPFPSEDGLGFGAVFDLDTKGQQAMQIMAATHGNMFLRATLNGQPIDVMRIDRAPADGRIVIWRGIPREIVALMDKKLPRIRGQAGAVDPGEGTNPTPRATAADEIPLLLPHELDDLPFYPHDAPIIELE